MPIQFILILAAAVMIIRSFFKLKNREIRIGEFITWLGIWLAVIVVVIYPDIASFLAIKLGVTRGADLVIYVALVLIFYLFFRFLVRLEKIEKDITKIVSHVTLNDETKKK